MLYFLSSQDMANVRYTASRVTQDRVIDAATVAALKIVIYMCPAPTSTHN